MAIIKTKILKDAIEELKENPKTITLYKSKYDDKPNTSNESFVTPKLVEVFEYMNKKNMFDKKYVENHEKLVNKDIKRMRYKEVLTELTYLYEEEQKTGGSLYKAFQEGRLLALLERLQKLNVLFVIPLLVN